MPALIGIHAFTCLSLVLHHCYKRCNVYEPRRWEKEQEKKNWIGKPSFSSPNPRRLRAGPSAFWWRWSSYGQIDSFSLTWAGGFTARPFSPGFGRAHFIDLSHKCSLYVSRLWACGNLWLHCKPSNSIVGTKHQPSSIFCCFSVTFLEFVVL